MPIKALRVEIIKPYNHRDENPLTWDELGEVLRNVRYAASKIANLAIQKLYAWERFSQNYKEENGKYPLSKEHREQWYSDYWYTEARKQFPYVAAQTINQIGRHAEKVWKSRKSEVLKLRQSVPSFKLNFPICLHNKDGYSVQKIEDRYIVFATLLSRDCERTRFSFVIKAGERSKQVLLDRIISGEYRKGAMQIISDRKKKWYCIIPYEFTPEIRVRLDESKVMGLDLGIVNAVYWGFNHSIKRGKIEGKEIEIFRKRVQERRKSIQRQGKYCGEGRIGHGRGRRLEPIELLQNKEANFRATTNHRYARRIIEVAVRNNCGVIQMEDLTGIKDYSKNYFLQNWTYRDLQDKIIEKAAEFNIKVVKINPEFTSQRCSECGFINKVNRPDQSTFVCKSCGYGKQYHCFDCGTSQPENGNCDTCGKPVTLIPVHADYNAARNIATPGIEQIIRDQLKFQEQNLKEGDTTNPIVKTKGKKGRAKR